MKSPRTHIKKMSASRAVEARTYAKRKKAFLRTHTNCARCGDWQKPEHRDLHHWAKRVGKLYLEERLWICLCRKCHDWVHKNEREAQDDGWLAPRGAVNDHARALKAWEKVEWATYLAELDGVE